VTCRVVIWPARFGDRHRGWAVPDGVTVEAFLRPLLAEYRRVS
jgi:hypothetical protein